MSECMDGKKRVEFLMNELLSFAKQMLREHGEFVPFGGYLKNSGEIVHVSVQPSDDSSQEKVSSLVASFRNLASEGDTQAFGIAIDVTLPNSDGTRGDAIEFLLEHKDGYRADVFFRYQVSGGAVKITEITAQEGETHFFVSVN